MNVIVSILYAVSSSVLLAIVLGFLKGGLSHDSAIAALGAGGIIGASSLLCARRVRPAMRSLNGIECSVVVVFALFSLRAFLWLVFIEGDAIKVLSPNNCGDLSLHLTYIRHLAQGASFWPENPIFAGGKLTYPLGMDLFNCLLSLAGMDDLRGLIWVGLIACVCTGMAIWRWGGAFTLAGFLCNGGLAGFAVFNERSFRDYQGELAWKSLPLALFVTQRGLLFALPAGLLLLSSWRARLFAQDECAWRLPRRGEVLLYASMPIFHFHTFLFLSVVMAVWFAVVPDARRELSILVGSALVPATGLVLLVTGFFHGASMLGIKPGWMVDDRAWVDWCAEISPSHSRLLADLLFWPMNFGALPLFVLALIRRLKREPLSPWEITLIATALSMFFLCCFVKFAPWEWDNTKLMLWSYLIVLPFLWSHVISRWSWLPCWTACVLLFFSGLVSLIGGLNSSHTGEEIARRSELSGVAAAVHGIPIGERFIGWPTYNHPLLLLGRPMALGYTGHAWSHGLDWEPLERQVKSILRGEADWREQCAKLGVRYLFWGAEELENVSNSPQPWRESARLVASGAWGELYDLAQLPEAPPAPPDAR